MKVPALIFDGECGFCLRLASWAERRLPPTVTIISSQSRNASAYGLNPRELTSAVYWIDARNRAWSAEKAVARTLKAMGGPWSILGSAVALPGISLLAGVGYRLVARNRRRLPGGTDACQLASEAVHR